jgi:putative MATE family efflux protein
MGCTVSIAHKIGARANSEVPNVIGSAIALFAALAVVLTVVTLIFARQFAVCLQAPEESFEKTVQYVIICSAGTIFIVAYNVISAVFRGLGDSKTPLALVGIACAANIIGDLLLVAVFHMDASGAALATIGAQAISVILSLIAIRKKDFPFSFHLGRVGFHKREIAGILEIGSPIALQDVLTTFSFLVMASLINSMGLINSAGYGIAQKLISFIMLIPSAFMQSMSAFVAQNIGANQRRRAQKAMLYGIGTALCIGAVMFSLGFFGGETLSGIFSHDAAVLAVSADYMKGFAFDCVIGGSLFCMMGYFNGCGKTMFVMAQGLSAAFLVRIPFAYIMSLQPNVTILHIGLSAPVASLFSVIICVVYYKRAKWNRPASAA